ncbi:MAG: 2Fe-2S iron-sulfur cluster-binding protein, partial [Thermoplasmatota archaeon]
MTRLAAAVPEFTFDGRPIPFRPGDTIGSALHRVGVKVISRSLRYHRPRGLYCVSGSCASCFVDVDGVPNVPACMRACLDGARVGSQNVVGSAQHDLLGVVDKVYRSGFDPHDAYTRFRFLNKVFNKGVRFLSGLGKAPPAGVVLAGPRRHTKEVDELIVGAGLHGLRRAHEASRNGRSVLVVDELPTLGGSARWDPHDHESRLLAQQAPHWPGVETWTEALCFGLYPHERAGKPPLAAIRRATALPDAGDLWEVSAGRITVAPGRHDAWPIFDNNDLPGVLSLRGALRLLGEHKVLPGKAVVGHGDPLPKAFVAKLQDQGGGGGDDDVGAGADEADEAVLPRRRPALDPDGAGGGHEEREEQRQAEAHEEVAEVGAELRPEAVALGHDLVRQL